MLGSVGLGFGALGFRVLGSRLELKGCDLEFTGFGLAMALGFSLVVSWCQGRGLFNVQSPDWRVPGLGGVWFRVLGQFCGRGCSVFGVLFLYSAQP